MFCVFLFQEVVLYKGELINYIKYVVRNYVSQSKMMCL